MSRRTYTQSVARGALLVSVLTIAVTVSAAPPTVNIDPAPPTVEVAPATFRSPQVRSQRLSNSASPVVHLAAHRYGAGYYGRYGGARYGYGGYRGMGLYYGANRAYAYGNPYLYRGVQGGFGYYGAYRPYLYSPYAYGRFGYYQPYPYPPYAYTNPLSLYGVYYAPAYRYRPTVPVSYAGCYYW